MNVPAGWKRLAFVRSVGQGVSIDGPALIAVEPTRGGQRVGLAIYAPETTHIVRAELTEQSPPPPESDDSGA